MDAKEATTGKRTRWLRRAGIGAGVALILFTIVGFLVVPPLARHIAQKQLTQVLGRKVVIDRIRVNPFALSAAVEGLHVFESDARTPFVEVRRFFVNAQLSSIWRRAPVIKEVTLDGLHVHVERRRATAAGWGDLTAYNFSDILAHLAASPPAPAARPPAPANAAPPRFSVNNIRVTDGRLMFDDRPLGAHHEISALTIGVPFVSTLPIFIDSFVEPGLSVRVDGTPFVVKGRSKPFKDSLETVLELRLDALDLTEYVPFVPVALPFTVDSARLTVALDVAFLRPKIDAPSLSVKGRIGLRDLTLREKRGPGTEPLPLLKLGRLDVSIGDANLTAQIFHVTEVRLAGLELDVRRQANGTLNLQRMLPRTASGPKEAPPSRSDAPQFTVQTVDLSGIKVAFEDRTTTPTFRATLDDVSLAVHGLSNLPGKTATLQFGARATPGGTIKQHGSLTLAPHLVATGSLELDGLEPGRFAPYYASAIAFDVVSARLRLGTGYHVEQRPRADTAVSLDGAFLELADLALRRRDRHEDILRLTELGIHGAKLDLGARKLAVNEVSLREGKLRAARDEKGTVDLTTLLPPSSSPAPASTEAQADSAPKDPAWAVTVAKLDLDKWSVRFDDRAVEPRAVLTVDPLSLHLTDISTAPGVRMGVALRTGINRTGSLSVTGTGGYQPVAANLRYELKNIDIVPFQSYFRDLVNLTVTNGAVSVKGQATVEIPAAAPRGTATRPPKASVEADLQVAGFACVDGMRKEPLVQWKSFRVSGVKATTSPALRIGVAEVGLDDLQARLTLLADGTTNLARAFAAAPTSAAPPASRVASAPAHATSSPARGATPTTTTSPAPGAASVPPQLDIGQVVLHRGAIAFSDRSIQPAFSADVTDLESRIRGLSSSADTQADVDLQAAINRAGSLSITGKANPLSKELFADIKVDVKDVELPPTSPYAGRYAGFLVDKGKLGISLDYHVANRQLQASNHVVLDQFTFGAKTDSQDAVKIPVRLAVAILKDRHGVIDLDLPIAGSLDDPQFKVGRLILKVLGNLIVKAVTAPFSYIGAAFGGGDQLSRLDFTAGSTALESKTKQKLASLQKALTERPGLSFEIEGIADPKHDRESVRQKLVDRQLAAERLAELTAEAGDTGRPVPPLDSIRVSASERARLVEKMYRKLDLAKGHGNPAGATAGPKAPAAPPSSPPSATDMEKALLDHATVSDDDLRTLALRRATLVQATLATSVPGSAGRLFLVRPRLDSGGARVDFRLKQE
jgi:uncharacterized protein involved in outer membrane biogenesis